MECIILAGGKGTRLGIDIPKALVQITDTETLLDIRLKMLKNQGINHFILAIGYEKNKVKEHILNNYLDWNIDFAEEDIPLGTGGAIKNAMQHCKEEQIFVTNVDDITNINLNDMKMSVLNQNAIAVTPLKSPYGVIIIDGNNVLEFKEKPVLNDVWVSCGFYYLRTDLEIPNISSIEFDVFQPLSKENKLKAFRYTDTWLTINTLKDLDDTRKNIDLIK